MIGSVKNFSRQRIKRRVSSVEDAVCRGRKQQEILLLLSCSRLTERNVQT